MPLDPLEEPGQYLISFPVSEEAQTGKRIVSMQAIYIQRFVHESNRRQIGGGQNEIPVVTHAERSESPGFLQ